MNYGDLEHFGPYQVLLVAYPGGVRRLLEWALSHFDKVTESQGDPLGSIGGIVVRTLGAVGTAETVDLLGTTTFPTPSSAPTRWPPCTPSRPAVEVIRAQG